MTVAVVIPAYDEAATIATIVQRARLQLETVIVVDDGSIDDTASQAAHAGAMVLRQPSNQGKGAALWHGLQQALALGAEAIITLDGDGQHRPEDLPKLFGAEDLSVTRWGTLRVDHKTMMTSLDGVFAAGDIVRGASLVVWGIRDGRDVTEHMHRYLKAKARAEVAA